MDLLPYNNFLITCVGASASFIGLLFVALSMVLVRNGTDSAGNATEIEFTDRRLAESSFTALGNIFFVSLASLTPGTNIGWPAFVLALLGLVSVWRLFDEFLKIKKEDRFSKHTQDIEWIFVSLLLYGSEAIFGILLLMHPDNAGYINILADIFLALFGAALVRSWELIGIRPKE